MADGIQVAQNEPVAASPSQGGEPGPAAYKVVPFTDKAEKKDDLYGFRTALAAHQQEEKAEKEPPRQLPLPLILGAIVLAGVVVVVLVLLFSGSAGISIAKIGGSKPPASYVDLGTQRDDQAGLGGRLIARWSDSGSYQFFIDPLGEDQMAGFQAVAQDPPHTLSFNLRFFDVSGSVVCQKVLLIPPMNGTGPTTDAAQNLQPRQTASGDTVQNMADRSGQVTEIVASGPLPCTMDAYRHITGWNFTSDFPDLDGQDEWLKHESVATGHAVHKSVSHPYGIYSLVKSLPAPVEGDDVIVSDNPGKGIVATSQGRIFLVGTNVLINRALDWQSFPAAVHFRCEKTATCVVTRLNSRTAVRARLLH